MPDSQALSHRSLARRARRHRTSVVAALLLGAVAVAGPASAGPVPHPYAAMEMPLGQTGRLELDAYSTTDHDAGSDIWFDAVSWNEMYFRPINGAKFSRPRAYVQDDYEGCRRATFTTASIPVTNARPNLTFCVLTSEGRIAEVSLGEKLGDAGQHEKVVYDVQYVVWPQATVIPNPA